MSQTKTQTDTSQRLRLSLTYPPEYYKEMAAAEARKIKTDISNKGISGPNADILEEQALNEYAKKVAAEAVLTTNPQAKSAWGFDHSLIPSASTSAEAIQEFLRNKVEKMIYDQMYNYLIGNKDTTEADAGMQAPDQQTANDNQYASAPKNDPILSSKDISNIGKMIERLIPEKKMVDPTEINFNYAFQINDAKIALEQQKLQNLLTRGAMYNGMRQDALHTQKRQYAIAKFGKEQPIAKPVTTGPINNFTGLNGM